MMMNIFLQSGVLILGFVTLVWIISLFKKDAGIMDIFWGLGFIFTALFVYMHQHEYNLYNLILVLMVVIWGLRLAIYIGLRNHGKPEDPRYRAWREQNGSAWWWRSYFKVFLLQGTVMWIVSLPLIYFLYTEKTESISILAIAGISIWTIGFIIETTADAQMRRFKMKPDNKGKILDKGLWGRSRHPNYFGEALVWCGFGLIGISIGNWLSLISPILMNFLLVKVSGVKMLDELMLKTKEGYREYMNKTNAFIPRLGGAR